MFHPRIAQALSLAPPVRGTPLDAQEGIAAVTGRRILVTGAGGSIGSELVRQIARARPAHLTLVDACEVNLYEIDLALQAMRPKTRWQPCIGDVRDADGMRHVMVRERPDIVFHAAALKHVPLLEGGHNLIEAVRTNVLGTRVICDLCAGRGIDLVLVSTDKAVNPSCGMGLTKRVAEIYVHEVARRYPEARIGQVRFGNVLGSSGSVVPLFRRQIREGGPVTVTHPEMTRYLMTIEEAAALTLAAAGLDQGGYALYVLDMGEPVNILELARRMIAAAGVAIPIRIVGPRPGEKLSEELTYPWETLRETSVPGVRVATPAFDPTPRIRLIDELLIAAAARRAGDVRQALLRIVPEFDGRATPRRGVARLSRTIAAGLALGSPVPAPALAAGHA